MNAGNTTPRGKEDSKGGKSLMEGWRSLAAEMIGAVTAIYQRAWSRDDQPPVIHFIEASVSLIAPVVVLWAAIDTHVVFSDSFHRSLVVVLVLLPPFLFMFACHLLKTFDKENAPLLAFSVLLFASGAVFTSNELFQHTEEKTIPCIVDCVESGMDCVLEPNCNQPGDPERRNPPWGDFLLAFSAFCVLVEEFNLFGLYLKINRRVKETERLKSDAAREHADLIRRTEDAQKKHEELTRLHKNASTLYRNMSRQSREWNESRQAVVLKACGVGGIIVLAFTSMCG